jgi:uncharacterized phage protein (TIGR01671 family)
MNRIPKFRGKDITGEWWYGNLSIKIRKLSNGKILKTYTISEIEYNSSRSGIVPETIGEFTGLTDKNGKEIYEGDIVVTSVSIGDVQFDCGVFGIERLHNKESRSMVGGWGQRHNLRGLDDSIIDDIEVVGNIHDNPELLIKKQK